MPTQEAPASVGEYVIERELGRGAFGVVYRAHRRDRPDPPVALKVVRGQGDADRLLLEPAVLSRLDHPCIVGLEDYFLRGSDLVLALEFIDGKDLKTLLEDGVTFTQADIRDLLLQIGSALAEAHAHNVIHRDLKPANVLVTRRDDGAGYRFVLTDFGIGQVREGVQSEKRTGGTYLFMAPEQLRGRPGAQSDLWALGVIAYRLLTSQMPFPGPSLNELTRQILYISPAPPSHGNAAPIDPDLEKAVLHLLDKSLQERTASAEQLLAELGHSGPTDAVLLRKASRDRKPAGGRSLDRQLDSGITKRKVLLGICVACYLLPGGLISGLMMLGGMALFFVAQRRGHWGRPRSVLLTLLSFLLLLGCMLLVYFFPAYNPAIMGIAQQSFAKGAANLGEWVPTGLGATETYILLAVGGTLVAFVYILYLFLPVIAGILFAGMRRLQRERVLRNLARQDDTSDRYLEALRESVDTRFEDVGLHLKYAEALFARGRVKEAAVEARILLLQDPYHFSGNLLLANAYYTLGLFAECVGLCERYLKVSGYCFEFGELTQQCQRRETS